MYSVAFSFFLLESLRPSFPSSLSPSFSVCVCERVHVLSALKIIRILCHKLWYTCNVMQWRNWKRTSIFKSVYKSQGEKICQRNSSTGYVHGFRGSFRYESPSTHKAREYSRQNYQCSLLTTTPPPRDMKTDYVQYQYLRLRPLFSYEAEVWSDINKMLAARRFWLTSSLIAAVLISFDLCWLLLK